MHPLVLEWIAQGSTEEELLVVTLDYPFDVPPFPEPAIGERWYSKANRQARKRAEGIIRDLELKRSVGYARFARELRSVCPNTGILDRSWLASGVLITAPVACADWIAELDDVVFVEPARPGDSPPRLLARSTETCDGVDFGRCRLRSDPYFDLGLDAGWISVLDTGMLSSQVLFNQPRRIRFQADCVSGKKQRGCRRGQQADKCNHGTKTGTVLSANRRLGNTFRGVTGIVLDSYNVYSSDCTLDIWAAVRGFQASMAELSQVIVAEITADQGSFLSRVADHAFDAGAVVVAAAGNTGPGDCTVRSPAVGRRVLGIGAVNVVTTQAFAAQSRGPASGRRIKPDIQAPTDTRTGDSNANDSTSLYAETSGATPYAAGAAALVRNWLWRRSATLDPGQVYAHLILAGQGPLPPDNAIGAGPIELPVDGWVWWGKVSVIEGEAIGIPLRVEGDGFNTFDGALWWPEVDEHSDLNLLLIDPEGEVRATGCSLASVFQRARVSEVISPGTWKLRIEGAGIPAGRQTVYWAARAWSRIEEVAKTCGELRSRCRLELP